MAASPVIGSVRGPYPDVTFNGSSSPVSAAASPTTSEHFGVINSHGAGGGLSQVGGGGGVPPPPVPPPPPLLPPLPREFGHPYPNHLQLQLMSPSQGSCDGQGKEPVSVPVVGSHMSGSPQRPSGSIRFVGLLSTYA